MSDALTDAPSVPSWVALVVLIGLIAVSMTAGRRRPREPQTARASKQLLDRLGWLPHVGTLLSLVPGTIALFGGGPWQAVLVIPEALLLLIALGVDAMTAIAISLALGYGLWQIAYAITRTAPSLSQAAG